MTFKARDVMTQANTTLYDTGVKRWTAQELCTYLNEGVRQIVTLKPNASTVTATITMVAGVKQSLADNQMLLVDAVLNVASKKPIQLIDRRETLDNIIPGWMDPAIINASDDVAYVIHDITSPRSFYVCPSAVAGKQIEVVVGVMPATIPNGASPADISTYTGDVPLPDVFQNPLIDYLLYRAFSKDAGIAGAGQRAAGHKQLFDASIGQVAASESAISLGAPDGPAAKASGS